MSYQNFIPPTETDKRDAKKLAIDIIELQRERKQINDKIQTLVDRIERCNGFSYNGEGHPTFIHQGYIYQHNEDGGQDFFAVIGKVVEEKD